VVLTRSKRCLARKKSIIREFHGPKPRKIPRGIAVVEGVIDVDNSDLNALADMIFADCLPSAMEKEEVTIE
jgi:hypothetical protein